MTYKMRRKFKKALDTKEAIAIAEWFSTDCFYFFLWMTETLQGREDMSTHISVDG